MLIKGETSISQRRGIITLILKKDKPLQIVKNWRQITLLNVDCKIIAKAIASRIKIILPKIIHSDQKGFVNGRFIGENIMELYALMDRSEEDDIDALLISIDFYKAFDTIEEAFQGRIQDLIRGCPDRDRPKLPMVRSSVV